MFISLISYIFKSLDLLDAPFDDNNNQLLKSNILHFIGQQFYDT
jgi:hypothetical protein